MQNNPQIREFIRHPSDVPIRVCPDRALDETELHSTEKLNNVSPGGLAFMSPTSLPIGQRVAVSLPLFDKQHQFAGKLVWLRKNPTGDEIEIQFNDRDELYSLRMIEQVCHIEHYRNEVEHSEGRQLSIEQGRSNGSAAMSADFGRFNDDR